MGRAIVGDSETEAYERDGVVCLRGVFSPHWVEVVARGIERNMGAPGPRGGSLTPADEPGAYFKDANVWPRIPEYVDYVHESPAGQIVAALMDSRTARLFIETTFVKEPGTREVAPWHQDQPYVCIDGRQCCSIWMPIDPVKKENGMAFVKGSHKWGKWYSPRNFFGKNDERKFEESFEPAPDIDGRPDEFDVVGWDMEPGDCAVFHMLTLHTSRPNAANTRRRAFSTRWVGDDATYAVRKGMMSAPYPVPGFEHGDPFESDQFPRVWPRARHAKPQPS